MKPEVFHTKSGRRAVLEVDRHFFTSLHPSGLDQGVRATFTRLLHRPMSEFERQSGEAKIFRSKQAKRAWKRRNGGKHGDPTARRSARRNHTL